MLLKQNIKVICFMDFISESRILKGNLKEYYQLLLTLNINKHMTELTLSKTEK